MMDDTTTIGLILSLTGILVQAIPVYAGPRRARAYVSAAFIATGLVLIFIFGNPARLISFYQANSQTIVAIFLLLLLVVVAFGARTLSTYRKHIAENANKIVVKEHVSITAENPFHEIVLDARRNCGLFYFAGKCLLLPRGRYKIAPNPTNPGGWSAWDSDDDPGAKRQIGPWTWKVFISVPRLTADFDDDSYVGSLTYRRAWQLGPETRWWRYRSKEDIGQSIFAQSEFPISMEFELPGVSPVWFWIWDEIPTDNRGEVRLYIYRLA